jgi:hypothetical protein
MHQRSVLVPTINAWTCDRNVSMVTDFVFQPHVQHLVRDAGGGGGRESESKREMGSPKTIERVKLQADT